MLLVLFGPTYHGLPGLGEGTCEEDSMLADANRHSRLDRRTSRQTRRQSDRSQGTRTESQRVKSKREPARERERERGLAPRERQRQREGHVRENKHDILTEREGDIQRQQRRTTDRHT